ncbi:MAG: hypothetical protein OHK0017_08060 [Patescibacteria group bacterium]
MPSEAQDRLNFLCSIINDRKLNFEGKLEKLLAIEYSQEEWLEIIKILKNKEKRTKTETVVYLVAIYSSIFIQ